MNEQEIELFELHLTRRQIAAMSLAMKAGENELIEMSNDADDEARRGLQIFARDFDSAMTALKAQLKIQGWDTDLTWPTPKFDQEARNEQV